MDVLRNTRQILILVFAAGLCLLLAPPPSARANTGPYLVKDIRRGADSTNIEGLVNVNGVLFFVADDALHGSELWKSDGTRKGTRLVKDIHPTKGSGIF